MNRLLNRTAGLIAALSCALSMQVASASSVTVVTHGFDIWADYFPGQPGGPLRDLGLGLYNYFDAAENGGAVEYLYNPTTMGLDWLRGEVANPNKIVVFDWSQDSNDPQAGYDEGAADVLFAVLKQNNLLNSDYLHLIGHSRGGVVSTQAARRILHYGYDVDQLTLLDVEEGPYPLNQAGPGQAWEGIGFVDNYYGSGRYAGIDFNLGGNQIGGAFNQRVYEDHDDFPEWYSKSISETFGLATGGFYWRVADPAARPAETGARTALAEPPDVINGNFSYGISVNDRVAGWWYHGGGGGGHVDLISVEDFDLELDYGDASKRHGWLYVPENAYQLAFQARIGGSWLNDDEFWITLDPYVGPPIRVRGPSLDSSRPMQWYSVDIRELADSVISFTFAIEAPGAGNPVDSQVEIDNVYFVDLAPGDLDSDGVVEGEDLTILQAGFGSGGVGVGWQQGDADRDHDVDGQDFLLWQQNLGVLVPPPTYWLPPHSTTPEPATLTLMIAALGAIFAFRRPSPEEKQAIIS
jgi:pimeloyl-ACP methyl ester carboxylesterase